MTELNFDDTKSFENNLEAFLVHMEAEDAEMGKILRQNVDSLKNGIDDSSRRKARSIFNPKILTELNELSKEAEGV